MIFYFAGELSGDRLGGELIDAPCVGVGGPAMQKRGLKPLFDFDAFHVMGFSSVACALPRILTLLHKIKRWILTHNPQGVVLIDYAEFNLLLAKKLRQGGYRGKIIHYVCPSVWAWRKKRVKTMEATLDLLLSILPFEARYFSTLPVSYVGHPTARALTHHTYTERYDGIALFPGSRIEEIKRNLPLQLEAAKRLSLPIYISLADERLRPYIAQYAPRDTLVPPHLRFDLMQTARGAIATCGTVVLELGLHQTPTVVTYPLSSLNYFLAKKIFKIHLPYYSLVNLIAQKELTPEFIDRMLDPKEIAHTLQRVMEHPLPFTLDTQPPLNPKEEIARALSM